MLQEVNFACNDFGIRSQVVMGYGMLLRFCYMCVCILVHGQR